MSTKTISTVFNSLLLLTLGAMLALNWLLSHELTDSKARIKRLEADVRTATAKYIDQGERFQDELDAARSEKAVELFTVQSELADCKKAKK